MPASPVRFARCRLPNRSPNGAVLSALSRARRADVAVPFGFRLQRLSGPTLRTVIRLSSRFASVAQNRGQGITPGIGLGDTSRHLQRRATSHCRAAQLCVNSMIPVSRAGRRSDAGPLRRHGQRSERSFLAPGRPMSLDRASRGHRDHRVHTELHGAADRRLTRYSSIVAGTFQNGTPQKPWLLSRYLVRDWLPPAVRRHLPPALVRQILLRDLRAFVVENRGAAVQGGPRQWDSHGQARCSWSRPRFSTTKSRRARRSEVAVVPPVDLISRLTETVGCEPKLWDRLRTSPSLPGLTRQPALQRRGAGCRVKPGNDGETRLSANGERRRPWST